VLGKWLEEQSLNYNRFEIKLYFSNLFSKLPVKQKNKNKNHKILELGAGSGQLTEFLTEESIIKLDIVKMPGIDVQADVYNIPIKNLSIDEIILVDVFHHLGKPWIFFEECYRILKKNGSLILVEPHRSIFSYPVFKLFHHEPMLLSRRYTPGIPILNDDPSSADNGIPTSVFMNKKNKEFLVTILKNKFEIVDNIKFSDFLSFFATGGLNRNKSIIKGNLFRLLLEAENHLPQFFLKIFGSRMIIALTKYND
jgi:ubiquinone/menaquinone biosynthesis C-methylase UbiE